MIVEAGRSGPMFSTAFLVLSALLAVAALSACSGDTAVAADEPLASRAEAPLRDTISALMVQSRAQGHDFGGQLNLPAIWLFDPDGRQQLQAVNESDADRLVAVATGDQPGTGGEGAMDLASVADALDPDLRVPHPDAAGGRWTAIVWLTDHGCSPVCERLKQAASALEDHAQVVTITLLTGQ